MEDNWNDYDYDNSWATTQAQIQTTTWQENSTHNIMERPQQELSTIPPRRQNTTALRHSLSAAQQQRNNNIEDTITHYVMYSNFKSYHHLPIDSGASVHVCPKDYAPDQPLRPCGESVPQLYTVTNKKIPVCLRHQVCSLQAGQLQDHDAPLRL